MSESHTSYDDTFCHDNLPPKELWPELNSIGTFNYPQNLNCAVELLDRAVNSGLGDKVAIYHSAGDWSYARLLSYANQIAKVLIEDLKLASGNRVLLRGYNTPALVATWFGVLKAGGICVTTMPLLRQRELEYIVSKAKISHALCEHSLLEEIKSLPLKTLSFSADGSGQLGAACQLKSPAFDSFITRSDDVALLAFTSGTTGPAKCTMHFHRDVLAICDCFPRSVLRSDSSDIVIGTPPLAFTFGLGALVLFPFRVGAACVMLERPGPEELLAAIERYNVTHTYSSPTGYRAMSAHTERFSLASLRAGVSAGEVLPASTRTLWRNCSGIELIDGIGATEMLHIFISASAQDARPGATGKVVPPYEAKVVDQNGIELAADQIGLLAVRGPTGCRYLDDIERQRSYVRAGWNFTGDAYRRDSQGYFWFHSRSDDMIISSGYNISGLEVEDVLMTHPLVRECAVVGVPDTERGQVVKACVVLKQEAHAGAVLERELQDFVKQQIAPYKYPRAIEFLKELPKTETGKVQRFRLR